MPHVVIVGAGPGGLTASILLAHAGVRVTLLERSHQVGGRTSTFTQQGFRFDYGPTFFHYPQVLESILASVGHDLWREIPLIKLDPHYRLIFGSGGELLCTGNIKKMRAEVARLCPEDAEKIDRFLAENRTKLACFRPFLESSFDSWRDTVRADFFRLLPVLKPWRSLDSDLSRYFRDPRVRLAFSFQSKYLGMSPFECPSLFTILSFLEYEYGIFHPVGGCGAVTTALARIARQMGVTIRCDTAVQQILTDKGKSVGVIAGGEEIRSDALVVNADFARAMTRLVPKEARRYWSDARLEKTRMSCSAFMLYLGVDGLYENLAHHTVYMSRDYRRNMQDIQEHRLSDDPSFYVQNACVTDQSLAPHGQSTIYALAPISHEHDGIDWTREKDRYRDLMLDKLESIGAKNIRQRIRFERVLTPQDWNTGFEVHKGAVFGFAHTWSQMLHLRPRNRFDEIGGVYLTGGSTHPGSGLPVIFESARISSRLLLQDLGIPITWTGTQPEQAMVAGVA